MRPTPTSTCVCPFKKAILNAHFGCENSVRRVPAVQSSIACCSEPAQRRCRALLDDLLAASRFALRIDGPYGSLPNGKLLKLQAGGLLGVRRLLDDSEPGGESVRAVANIHGTLERAEARFGSLRDLPFDRVVRAVTHYRLKRRSTPSAGSDS